MTDCFGQTIQKSFSKVFPTIILPQISFPSSQVQNIPYFWMGQFFGFGGKPVQSTGIPPDMHASNLNCVKINSSHADFSVLFVSTYHSAVSPLENTN